MSMSRIIRYAVGLAIVLAISAQAAQAAAPDHLRSKGQDVPRLAATPAAHRALNARADRFDWSAAFVGAGSATGVVLVAAGAAVAVRSRRRVALF